MVKCVYDYVNQVLGNERMQNARWTASTAFLLEEKEVDVSDQQDTVSDGSEIRLSQTLWYNKNPGYKQPPTGVRLNSVW